MRCVLPLERASRAPWAWSLTAMVNLKFPIDFVGALEEELRRRGASWLTETDLANFRSLSRGYITTPTEFDALMEGTVDNILKKATAEDWEALSSRLVKLAMAQSKGTLSPAACVTGQQLLRHEDNEAALEPTEHYLLAGRCLYFLVCRSTEDVNTVPLVKAVLEHTDRRAFTSLQKMAIRAALMKHLAVKKCPAAQRLCLLPARPDVTRAPPPPPAKSSKWNKVRLLFNKASACDDIVQRLPVAKVWKLLAQAARKYEQLVDLKTKLCGTHYVKPADKKRINDAHLEYINWCEQNKIESELPPEFLKFTQHMTWFLLATKDTAKKRPASVLL